MNYFIINLSDKKELLIKCRVPVHLHVTASWEKDSFSLILITLQQVNITDPAFKTYKLELRLDLSSSAVRSVSFSFLTDSNSYKNKNHEFQRTAHYIQRKQLNDMSWKQVSPVWCPPHAVSRLSEVVFFLTELRDSLAISWALDPKAIYHIKKDNGFITVCNFHKISSGCAIIWLDHNEN